MTKGSAEPVASRLRAFMVPQPNGCILFAGYIDRGGYGRVRDYDGTTKLAHRVAYEVLVGPIADGLTIDHLCHTADASCLGGTNCAHRRCINPEHLELVSIEENKSRGRSPAALNARKTHCVHGHEFSAENTRVEGSGRRCKECAHAKAKRYRARYAEELATKQTARNARRNELARERRRNAKGEGSA